MVHEGGRTISRAADGQLLFHPCGGKSVARNPQREPVEDAVGRMREWAEERGVEPGPETNMPLWDGSRHDHNRAVSGLLDG